MRKPTQNLNALIEAGQTSFPAGEYKLTKPITISERTQYDFHNNAIIHCDDTDWAFYIPASDVWRVKISGGEFRLNGNTFLWQEQSNDPTGNTISNAIFDNIWIRWGSRGFSSQGMVGCSFRDVYFDVVEYPIEFHGGRYGSFNANTIDSCLFYDYKIAINLLGLTVHKCSNVITNNRFEYGNYIFSGEHHIASLNFLCNHSEHTGGVILFGNGRNTQLNIRNNRFLSPTKGDAIVDIQTLFAGGCINANFISVTDKIFAVKSCHTSTGRLYCVHNTLQGMPKNNPATYPNYFNFFCNSGSGEMFVTAAPDSGFISGDESSLREEL